MFILLPLVWDAENPPKEGKASPAQRKPEGVCRAQRKPLIKPGTLLGAFPVGWRGGDLNAGLTGSIDLSISIDVHIYMCIYSCRLFVYGFQDSCKAESPLGYEVCVFLDVLWSNLTQERSSPFLIVIPGSTLALMSLSWQTQGTVS